ncbi:hypothetical protein [Bacillus paramycoides]|uniref:Uncharacterized protein n=1 Tax=Bacillus paramycoides TaxID=2026194 RepID=A0ABU6MZV2_9BACI|nr:hypothetical protein [Bacillus paramycoides]
MRNLAILGTALLLAGATVFFPPAGVALFVFKASVGVMAVSSCSTGKRLADTTET